MRQILPRSKFLIAALITLGLFGGTVTVRADDHDDRKCERRIHKAQEQLERAVRKHGEHSEQAEQRRHQLEEARERCHHDHDRDHDDHH